MYRGGRYWVTCSELGLPEDKFTKDESYQAANQWWEQKLVELSVGNSTQEAVEDADYPQLPEIRRRADFARRHGLASETESFEAEIREIRNSTPGELSGLSSEAVDKLKALKILTGVDLSDMDPVAAEAVFGAGDVWGDRFAREKLVHPEKTIGALANKWLTDRQDEARKGIRSHESADALRRHVHKFRDHCGASSPVECITAELWQRWYIHCAGKVADRDATGNIGWTADTAKKVFTVGRSFVRWLGEEAGKLPALPLNLNSPKHKFERPAGVIPTFSDAEVTEILSVARGAHRLILLLMLNTGMTQKDVADLKKSELDLDQGRITRFRSKMRKSKAGRLVSYKLWPETIALLQRHMSTDPVRVLTTKSGQPWVWTQTTPGGDLRKSDNVATIFNALKRKIKLIGKGKSPKVFRKTSASRLKRSADFRDLRFWFLGHSERTIADRHYAAADQQHLDAAINWLRTQYQIPADASVDHPSVKSL